MNINRYRADPEEKGPAVAVQDEDYAVGDLVAARDSDDSKTYWPAEILAVDAGSLKLHYWGTTGKNPAVATWRPAHIGATTGKTILAHEPAKRGERTSRWCGLVDPDLIISNIGMKKDTRKNHHLTRKSVADLYFLG